MSLVLDSDSSEFKPFVNTLLDVETVSFCVARLEAKIEFAWIRIRKT